MAAYEFWKARLAEEGRMLDRLGVKVEISRGITRLPEPVSTESLPHSALSPDEEERIKKAAVESYKTLRRERREVARQARARCVPLR